MALLGQELVPCACCAADLFKVELHLSLAKGRALQATDLQMTVPLYGWTQNKEPAKTMGTTGKTEQAHAPPCRKLCLFTHRSDSPFSICPET